MRVMYGEKGDYSVIETNEVAISGENNENLVFWDYEGDEVEIKIEDSTAALIILNNLLIDGYADLRDRKGVYSEEAQPMECF